MGIFEVHSKLFQNKIVEEQGCHLEVIDGELSSFN
jgi:hypothetical protein